MESKKISIDHAKMDRLAETLNQLRELCPWDRKQTIDSLRQNTIEETYELSDAILRHHAHDMKKELGDLLLHVLFYSKIAAEEGWFTIDQVVDSLVEKLRYRHPHIYGDVKADDAQTVVENWERLKMKEKDRDRRVLSGVPGALPPMVKAFRIQQKAQGVGFDWERREQVWDKVGEELREAVDEARRERVDTGRLESEIGDLIFAAINAARLYEIDPEKALETTNQKFIRRFNYLEEKTILQGNDLKNMTLAQMDAIWDEAKRLENREKE